MTDFSILAFADNCHDILEIDLHGCINLTDISVTALITEGRQLRELRLAHCSRITDEAFLQLAPEQRFDCLRILDLTDCHELQDAGLQKIVQAAPRLRNLVLAKCRYITDRGVMAITRLGKNLHYIHLGHCVRLTDFGVISLVKYCNRIRYIDLACCSNLTDESVKLLASLPKLKRIGLVKCSNITDRSIKALAQPKPYGSGGGFYPNNLERLHLSYCSNLTVSVSCNYHALMALVNVFKQGIRTMLINCPRLTHLSLTGVHEFLRDDILQHCREAPTEFNDHQRDVFCVFSGPGVIHLRRHLSDNYPSPPQSEADMDEDLDGLAPPPPPNHHFFANQQQPFQFQFLGHGFANGQHHQLPIMPAPLGVPGAVFGAHDHLGGMHPGPGAGPGLTPQQYHLQMQLQTQLQMQLQMQAGDDADDEAGLMDDVEGMGGD